MTPDRTLSSSAGFWQRILLLEHSPIVILRTAGKALLLSLRPESMLRAEAIAFVMFLAFFPALLFLAGAIALLVPGWEELLGDLRQLIPPGSRRAVLDSLQLASQQPVHLLVAGGLGTLLLGSQLMASLTRVLGMIYGRENQEGFWRVQLRALSMVFVTVVPWAIIGVALVFGRYFRGWLSRELGTHFHAAFQVIWTLGYFALVFLTATLVVATLYHFLTPGRRESWHEVMPGAFLAMLCWWVVSSGFGFYVSHISIYNAIYGGFAAAIGLLVWMFLSSLVILIGAQFNAELEGLSLNRGNRS